MQPPSRLQAGLSYLIDRAVSRRVDVAQSVVISGFWRSGTTWVQQWLAAELGAKTIFEPLHPLTPEVSKLHRSLSLADRSAPFRDLYLPFKVAGQGQVLDRLIHAALQARLRGRAVRRLRPALSHSFRTRVVVKVNRGPLFLSAVQASLGMPVVHIQRDPRAIIASINMTGWDWLFNHLHLREQLLDLPDGRAAFFEPWADLIDQSEELGRTYRISLYWALTEHFYRQQNRADGSRTIRISYEQLCLDGPDSLRPVLAGIGVHLPPGPRFSGPIGDSSTTAPRRRGISTEERIFGWRSVLSSVEVAEIESLAHRFDLQACLLEP